jgi:endonuclease-8
LSTDRAVVVGFNLPVLERLSRARLERHPQLSALGPDLLSAGLDVPGVVSRLRACPQLALGEALLEQRIACGVGNVYKSESLYLCRLDPWAPISQVPDDALAGLIRAARALMLRNLDGNMRRTVARAGQGRYHVYGREGWPCLECSTPIEMRRQGDQARSTYFCPACQRTSVRGRANVQPAGARC